MTGIYQHSLDAKGRVFIPAKLREELGDVFYVTISMDNCLCAYNAENWQVLSDKVNAMPYVKQRRVRPLFANAAKCELDGQGRILLPQLLRDYAKLSKNVTVVGTVNCAEIWDADKWSTVSGQELTAENINKIYNEMDF